MRLSCEREGLGRWVGAGNQRIVIKEVDFGGCGRVDAFIVFRYSFVLEALVVCIKSLKTLT